MSKEVERYDAQKLKPWSDETGEGFCVVEARDYEALLAERDALEKDAERMAFIEEHPNWLRKHKKHWQCVNPFTNYEYPVFKTAREAVDAALQGEQP